jgi:hypothetical protein
MVSLEVRTPVAGSSGPPTWSISGAAALNEQTNFNTPAPDRVGSFILHRSAVFENFDMSVSVRGTDNDSVGLIFWYIDDQNYLRFSVDEQTSEAKIMRMTPNGGVTLALTSGAFNFNNDTVLRVRTSGRDISAFVNGTQLMTAQDRHIMVGRVGIYENAMADVHFFGWTVTPLAPTAGNVTF